jgi:ligand-binding sensor domain-containing protein
VFASTDAGSTWQSVNAGLTDSSILSLIAAAGNQLLAGSARGEIFSLSLPDSAWRLRFSVARPIVSLRLTTSGKCLAGALNGGVYEFDLTFSGIVQANAGLPDLSVVTVYSLGADWVYAGTRSSGLFRSDAKRIFWGEVGVDRLDRRINVLRIIPGGDLLAGTGTGVYLSKDNGVIWVRAGLDGLAIYALEVNTDGTFFAGTADGVYRGVLSAVDDLPPP